MRADQLALDYRLYPRDHLNTATVTAIKRAMQAGEQMDPIIADRTTLRVVDGFHRVTAALALDVDADIGVELRDYPDDGALFLEAVRANARHGTRLTPYDAARCAIQAEELHIDPVLLAGALALTVEALGELTVRKTAVGPDGTPVAIKATIRHLAGSQLTERAARANRRAGGMSPRYFIAQLKNIIEEGVLPDDAPTHAALVELREIIDAHLSAVG